MNLTLNTYTQWYWKIDLHNLMHFLRLRSEVHAQYEIRAYAEAILSIMQLWVPLAYEAFTEYRLGAAMLSKTALEIVRRMLKGEKVDQHSTNLSAREWDELKLLLQIEE